MLFSLLTMPIDGFKFILNTIAKIAEEQYTDDAPLKERLLELQVLLDQGDISEDQYAEAETAILRELREVQNRKREMAGAPREDAETATGLSGKVAEGSGVSITADWHQDE